MKNIIVIIFILSICFSTSVFAQNPSSIIEIPGMGTYILVSEKMTPCIKELDSLAVEVEKTMVRADVYQQIVDTLIARTEYIQATNNDVETRYKVGSELLFWVMYVNNLHNEQLAVLKKQAARMAELESQCKEE